MYNEFNVLDHLKREDEYSYNERKNFFSKQVLLHMCTDSYPIAAPLIAELQEIAWDNYKGLMEMTKKIWKYLDNEIKLHHLSKYQLVNIVDDIWSLAYRANGYYYTLKNMIAYHNCIIKVNGTCYTNQAALNVLREMLDSDIVTTASKQLTQLHEVLQIAFNDTIRDNEFSWQDAIRGFAK